MSFYKIRPRSGTASQWATANTVLGEREIGYELPDGGVGTGIVKMKMGDGVTPWNDLPYALNEGEFASDLETINNNLTANNQLFKYAYQDGKYGYIAEVEGADTFFPFKNGVSDISTIISKGSWTWGTSTSTHNVNVTLPTGYELFIVYAYSYGGESATNPTLSSDNLLSSKTKTQTRGGTTIGLYQKDKNSELTVSASASCTSGSTSARDLVIVAVPLS